MTIDVKGRWAPRGTTSVLRADGATPIPWDVFNVVDQLEVKTDEGNGIIVAAKPRVAPEVAKAAGDRDLRAIERKPFQGRWMPGRVCTSCSETDGATVALCDDDPFGPW